jgi:hypothetical protein
MAPWKLPLIVAGIAVPIVAGFFVGGAGVGVAVGALAVLAILVVAARQRPYGPIESAPAGDGRRHVLLVVTCPLEEPAMVRKVVGEAELETSDEGAEVLVLAPTKIGFLDRWASDVEEARRQAQQHLVATVAALAKAGVGAEARVGDENVVQAVEDQLHSFPATEVVLIEESGAENHGEAAELELRLTAKFHRVVLGES